MNTTFEEYFKTKKASQEWIEYETLMSERPQEFTQNEMLEIITDFDTICKYEYEHEMPFAIGIQYHSKYSMMVVDLVKDPKGNIFSYERRMPAVKKGPAVVSIPVWENHYVLLNQYRHALRDYQLSFPRGFGEEGLNGNQNVEKELMEELGISSCTSSFIGKVVADSGVSGDKVEVYLCQLHNKPLQNEGYEGIKNYILVEENQLKKMIHNGEINDGFTLSALQLLNCR